MNLATYGSLMIPEVMHALLQKDFSSELATLDGFERYLLKGKRYPGVTTPPRLLGSTVIFVSAVDFVEKF